MAGYLAWDEAPAITGWRYWVVDLSGTPPLVSPFRQYPFPAYREMTAVCDLYDHDAAAVGCSCGFTSAYDRDHLTAFLSGYYEARLTPYVFERVAIGRVAAPGRRAPAYEGSGFFRHRWCSLRELFVSAALADASHLLADHYQVPVTVGRRVGLAWLEELRTA